MQRDHLIAQFGSFEFALADRYHFDEVVGRGAMGTVYRATDRRLGRPVAIKMLHPMLTHEVGVRRFESEILLTASMRHHNICPVYDSGDVDGQLFFVMPYLGTESLRTRLRRERRLRVEDATAIARDVAEGLHHAHERGLVHRDIKPENIMLSDGAAVIVDFGLARIVNDAGSERLTETGVVVGTAQYLSPEQAAAEKEVGPAADQYALACVLFEMLTGEPPFTAATPVATAMRHVRDVPPELMARRADAPSSIGAAVARAFDKSAERRFATVLEFSNALASSDNSGRVLTERTDVTLAQELRERYVTLRDRIASFLR